MSAGDDRAFAYLHGFASSAKATKGSQLATRFDAHGLTLERPDLNCPSFGKLTVTAMLAALDAIDVELRTARGDDVRWSFVGSSMGAWVGALWAHANPSRVEAVVWLAPGFFLAQRWPTLIGRSTFAAWEARGSLALPDATGRSVDVHFDLIRDGLEHAAAPTPVAPTVIVHGRQDATVPIQISRDYVARFAQSELPPRLVEVEDDHRLLGSVDKIWAIVTKHFALDEAGAEP